MAYSQLLENVIEESELTIKEIVEKCEKESGVKITSSYISQLKSGKMNAPSDEVSRAIALACSKDSELLVLESYIEKAPKEIVNVLNFMKVSSMSTVLNLFAQSISVEEGTILKEGFMKMPLSEFILQINNTNSVDSTNFSLNDGVFEIENELDSSSLNIKLNEDIGIPMIDGSMESVIPKNALISFELLEVIKNGEIVAYKEKDNKDILVRRIYKDESQIMMVPDNKLYQPKLYEENHIVILGKVNKIIIKI